MTQSGHSGRLVEPRVFCSMQTRGIEQEQIGIWLTDKCLT